MRTKLKGKTRRAYLSIAVVGGVIVFTYLVWQGGIFTYGTRTLLSVSDSGPQLAGLVLDFGDGIQREFRGEVVPEMTVLDALRASTRAGELELSYEPADDGMRIAKINGKEADGEQRWVFYVNGERGEDPATYEIQSGDKIAWRYE